MRGYPKGLRAGSDPRKPLISVDEHFEKIEYRSVPSVLYAIEVRTHHDCSAHIPIRIYTVFCFVFTFENWFSLV